MARDATTTQGTTHASAFIRMRRRVQSTQRRDHLARGADRRVLKESGASPSEGTLLDESGNARYDSVGKRIHVDVPGRDPYEACRACPWSGVQKSGPDSVDPVQATTPCVVVETKGVAATPARPSSKTVTVRSVQDLTSVLAVTSARAIIRQSRPSVACTDRDRGPYSWPTGESVPDAGGPLNKGASVGRRTAAGRRHDMEARGAAAVESQAKDPMANLAYAESLTSEKVRGNIAHELTREVRFDVGPHGVE